MGGALRGQYIVWFHWERRAEELSDAFGYPVEFLRDVIPSRRVPWFVRLPVNYFWKTVATLLLLFRRRPQVVVAQSPPSFCAMVCQIYCSLTGARLVVDGHNGAYQAPWIRVPAYPSALESAHAVFVHNQELLEPVQAILPRARLRVLYDRIPLRKMADGNGGEATKAFFLVVCSYDPDEPIAEMLGAASAFVERHGTEFEFRFTGDSRKQREICELYQGRPGLIFTGFLSQADYDSMLADAFAVLCLSTDENVQQCGSIEAMAAGVPVIVSDSRTNQNIFPRGALLALNQRDSVLSKLEEMVSKRDQLRTELQSLRVERTERWKANFQDLRAELAI